MDNLGYFLGILTMVTTGIFVIRSGIDILIRKVDYLIIIMKRYNS